MSDKGKLIRDIERARGVLSRRIVELEEEQALARVQNKMAETKGLKPPIPEGTIQGIFNSRERLVAESNEMYTWLLKLETEFQAENFPTKNIEVPAAAPIELSEPPELEIEIRPEPTIEELKEEYEQPVPGKRRRRGKK